MRLARSCGALGLLVSGSIWGCAQATPGTRWEAGGSGSVDPNAEATDSSDTKQTGTASDARNGADPNGSNSGTDGESATSAPHSDCSAGLCDASAGGAPQDPFAGGSTCSSGAYWVFFNLATDLMYPGRACNDCHRKSLQRTFSVAGTVYKTGHEPDDCFGASGASGDLVVELTDSSGKVVKLTPGPTGNFNTRDSLQFPLTARVVANGRERVMDGEIDEAGGDCNSCHTENGTQDAPGRIAEP